MNDPWDVKSVRQPGQYVSCMKISGVPLLPPVLSKECRKEMQYYKLLAKEVEKRISLLQPYVFDSCSSSSEVDPTEAPELPECEQNYELTEEDINVDIVKIRSVSPPYRGKEILLENMSLPMSSTSKYYIDVNLNINETVKNTHSTTPRVRSPPPRDLPERDYNCVKRVAQKVVTEKQVITNVETNGKRNVKKKNKVNEEHVGYNKPLSDPFSGIPLPQDGPSSLSSKSFTGSLNNIHSESIKDHIDSGKLIRQRSYTLLKPSPQLLAHLEVHSQNTGVEMTSISMSESLSNISSSNKKRRSWDLESAKVKWSTMALELKQTNVINVISKNSLSKNALKSNPKNVYVQRAKFVAPTPVRRNNGSQKPLAKSEPLPNTKRSFSPVRNKSDRSVKTESVTPKGNEKICTSTKRITTSISESEDPAAHVRELYEKIQKQQLVQMANLVEKQKKEQMLLQQVFEEQNNLLYKQLKTICPKSPIEAKEAWGDQLLCEGDRGPVSLSQVINYKSPDQSAFSSPVSITLNDTNNYINHCDNVLKKSRDITGGLKKQPNKSVSQNRTKIQSPSTQPEGSRTRTNSPVRRTATSRRLNYDSSASTDRDYEEILTDRTNDTLADLNVTFPSDHSDEANASVIHNKSAVNHLRGKEIKTNHGHSAQTTPSIQSRSTENAIRNMERSISSSMNSISARSSKTPVFINPPSAKERAAATKIVAHVKGYLVRRLMRTDQVQGIVQTIKDALLCALQLHQDREGIRGADVDLHRRLIQQITAACYTLHDTFVASSPAERCAMIAADRGKRRRSIASRPHNISFRQTDIMSQSHTGSFPARAKSQQPPSLMTQSNYETFSSDKSSSVSRRYMASPRRRPWR